jgi:hypothetical protein
MLMVLHVMMMVMMMPHVVVVVMVVMMPHVVMMMVVMHGFRIGGWRSFGGGCISHGRHKYER